MSQQTDEYLIDWAKNHSVDTGGRSREEIIQSMRSVKPDESRLDQIAIEIIIKEGGVEVLRQWLQNYISNNLESA